MLLTHRCVAHMHQWQIDIGQSNYLYNVCSWRVRTIMSIKHIFAAKIAPQMLALHSYFIVTSNSAIAIRIRNLTANFPGAIRIRKP